MLSFSLSFVERHVVALGPFLMRQTDVSTTQN